MYSFLPTHGGMAQAESTGVPVLRWFTHTKMVTHPVTKWVRHEVTMLIETNVLLVSQTYIEYIVEILSFLYGCFYALYCFRFCCNNF